MATHVTSSWGNRVTRVPLKQPPFTWEIPWEDCRQIMPTGIRWDLKHVFLAAQHRYTNSFRRTRLCQTKKRSRNTWIFQFCVSNLGRNSPKTYQMDFNQYIRRNCITKNFRYLKCWVIVQKIQVCKCISFASQRGWGNEGKGEASIISLFSPQVQYWNP